MKGWVSKDKFLISGLGRGGGAVFFIVCSYRRKQESKTKPIPSREKTMFTECACASHVCLPRSDSTQLTLRRGPSLKVAQPVQPYIPATLWAAVAHDGQPMAQLTCPEKKGGGSRVGMTSHSFLLTSSFPMMVRSQQHPCPNATCTAPQPWCARVFRPGFLSAPC